MEWVAAVASAVATVVSFWWYYKSRSAGHLIVAVAFLIPTLIFSYLATT
jgi:hypothetical protein